MPTLDEITECIAAEFPQGRAIIEAVDERSCRVGRTPTRGITAAQAALALAMLFGVLVPLPR